MATLANRISTFFRSGYDAVTSTGRRKAASAVLRHEDNELKGRERNQAIGTGRNLHRNFGIVRWAVRKHLDYVTAFDFQMRTGVKSFDAEAERLMTEWQRPANCDIARRHPFKSMLRLFESRRVIDGDAFCMFRSQGRLQPIESDLIRQPDERKLEADRWFNGVQVTTDGAPLNYGLHKRTEHGRYEFLRSVKASSICHLAEFDRFDQVRGISPLISAFNSFQDVYEGVDYALAKMKVEQLFAMVITSSNSDGLGDHTKDGDEKYSVDFGKGPVKIEMDPDEDAKFLSSQNPSTQTQQFLHTVLGMAIKALDLPFNFYDESHTNFFGSRAAWLLYDRSCKAKRDILIEFLRKITVWRIQLWVQDGLLRLPRGKSIRDLPFEWVHLGMPWWDPAKEIKGDKEAVSAGLDNPYRICKERGRGEFEDNIDQIAKAQAYAESKGVTLSFGTVSNVAPPSTDDDDEDDE